jgi:hypothetical protein
VSHEFQIAWIKRYTEGDKTYPYQAMRWYEKERKERSLTADEEKTVLWLKERYGLEALLRNVSMESSDWTQRKGR